MTEDATEQKGTKAVMRLLSVRSQRCVAVVRLLSDDRAVATSLCRRLFLPAKASLVTRGAGCRAAFQPLKPDKVANQDPVFACVLRTRLQQLAILHMPLTSHDSYLMHACWRLQEHAYP